MEQTPSSASCVFQLSDYRVLRLCVEQNDRDVVYFPLKMAVLACLSPKSGHCSLRVLSIMKDVHGCVTRFLSMWYGIHLITTPLHPTPPHERAGGMSSWHWFFFKQSCYISQTPVTLLQCLQCVDGCTCSLVLKGSWSFHQIHFMLQRTLRFPWSFKPTN